MRSSSVVDMEKNVFSMTGSQSNDIDKITNWTDVDQRFPLAEPNRTKKPAAENTDAGESDAIDKKADNVNDGGTDKNGDGHGEECSDDDLYGVEFSTDSDDDDDEDYDDDDDDDDDGDNDYYRNEEDDEEEEDMKQNKKIKT
ncbi:hypothetical protein CFOL_v3_29222 [Cephalotus follicularis]|uniref:Uncharacterized protein n=1 Tax=Cephalotus follicularis TaxID=3775 RepID=A0A1Q3D0F3_CEPFO|nr:hypothetical protein CFOL_v3_29222 [Cephalotus follicularis]